KTLSQRYEELAKSNMASHVQLSGRITALTTENTTLKARVTGKQNSISKSLAKPKVTATGMVVTPVKKVWKATGKVFARVGFHWQPTGRMFTLDDMCPLNRITSFKVLPVEHSSSVSTSVDVVVSSRFIEMPVTSYKRKARKAPDVSVSTVN
nr:hypothetical protein [Tanacetum cinerariifolium]